MCPQYKDNLLQELRNRPCGLQANIDIFDYKPSKYYNVGSASAVEYHYCEACSFLAENEKTNQVPHFGKLCCNQGKCILDDFPDLPDDLMALYTEQTPRAKYFWTNIRYFNFGMSMGSVQVNEATVRQGGPAAWKVYEHLHRRIENVTAATNDTQWDCHQTYFCDTQFQDAYRARMNENLSIDSRNTSLDTSIF